MTATLEEVARVGFAGWFRQSVLDRDEPPVLGIIGDERYLLELDARHRERLVVQLVDDYEVDDRGLPIEIVLFGTSGGIFASAASFLELWPKVPSDASAEVFIDDRHRAAFTKTDDGVVMSVRHVLRPDRPPRRRLRFPPDTYETAISALALEWRRLRDDLLAVAQLRAPEKAKALQAAFASQL